MVRALSIHEFSSGELIKAIEASDEPIVIVESSGTPWLVVMSPREYDRLRGDQCESTEEMIQHLLEQSPDDDPIRIMRDVTREVEAVRQEHYEKRLAEQQEDR